MVLTLRHNRSIHHRRGRRWRSAPALRYVSVHKRSAWSKYRLLLFLFLAPSQGAIDGEETNVAIGQTDQVGWSLISINICICISIYRLCRKKNICFWSQKLHVFCSESYVDIVLGLHVDELVLVCIGKEKNHLPIKSATVSVITWFNFLCLGSHIWWLHWVPIALRFGIRILTSGCLDWMDPLFSYGMVKQKQISPSWLTQAIVQTAERRWCPLIQLILFGF